MKAPDAPDPYRVFRCDLVELEPCGPRLLGRQLQVILSAGVKPRWLHSADTVAVPAPEPGPASVLRPGTASAAGFGRAGAVRPGSAGNPDPNPDPGAVPRSARTPAAGPVRVDAARPGSAENPDPAPAVPPGSGAVPAAGSARYPGTGPPADPASDPPAGPGPPPGAPPGPPAPRLLTAAEVFDRLPGCRTVVLPGPPPSVHLRGAHACLTVPDPVTAAIVAAFADVLPAVPTRALLRAAAVTAASPITARPSTAGRPAASAVLRLPGRTVRCEWRALD